jgi:DNA-binding SARP family transcriptional activator
MTGVRVSLFGKVSVICDGRPVSALSMKALELFCYLLLFRDRAHSREALSELLWPGTPESLSRKYLRKTLWQLRTTLNEAGGRRAGVEPILRTAAGWVRANPDGDWWLDVDAFEQAYGALRNVPGEDMSEPQARSLHEAARLYCGDLVESWYQDWCLYERDRLKLVYVAMLDKLMEHCEATRSFGEAVAYGNSILRHDPAREATHRRLMRLHYQSGDRGNALRQYDRCVTALAAQFDLGPSPETVALHEQLRAGRFEARPAAVVGRQRVDAAVTASGDLRSEIWRRLGQVRDSLAAVQEQVSELTMLCRVVQGSANGHGDGRRDDARYNGS